MNLEQRMQKIEVAFGAQSDLVRELRDAVTVTAELEARQSRLLKEHTVALANHTDWLVSHDKAMREHDERMKTLDERIASLVSGMGEFMRRRN
jgi:uncharacterized coiled-coil protein SlyX